MTREGIHLDLYRGGVHLTFPPGSVTESTTIMVHRWKYGACLPNLGEHEAVVSNVIKISAKIEALEFEDEVKLALSHSASDLEGYELVIKKLLDAESNEWEEVDGCKNIPGISGFNICFMKSLFRWYFLSTFQIHLIPKWRPINSSFVCMLISPLRLLSTLKFICFLYMLTRRKGLINMQTKE